MAKERRSNSTFKYSCSKTSRPIILEMWIGMRVSRSECLYLEI